VTLDVRGRDRRQFHEPFTVVDEIHIGQWCATSLRRHAITDTHFYR
jgi:hypothetical protein